MKSCAGSSFRSLQMFLFCLFLWGALPETIGFLLAGRYWLLEKTEPIFLWTESVVLQGFCPTSGSRMAERCFNLVFLKDGCNIFFVGMRRDTLPSAYSLILLCTRPACYKKALIPNAPCFIDFYSSYAITFSFSPDVIIELISTYLNFQSIP